MSAKDIRWIQRFNHFLKALVQLREAVELSRQRPLSKLEQQGLIQAFEFTHELAWNTLSGKPRRSKSVWVQGRYPQSLRNRLVGEWRGLDGHGPEPQSDLAHV